LELGLNDEIVASALDGERRRRLGRRLMKLTRQIWLVILALVAAITVAGAPASAQQQLEGQVLLAGEPIAGAAVTLWTAGADAPAQLAQAQTGADGRFALSAPAGNNPCI
jgi:hypothetical protein